MNDKAKPNGFKAKDDRYIEPQVEHVGREMKLE